MFPLLTLRSLRPVRSLAAVLCLVLLACSDGTEATGPNPPPPPDDPPPPATSARISGIIAVSDATASRAAVAAAASSRMAKTGRDPASSVRAAVPRTAPAAQRKSAERQSTRAQGRTARPHGLAERVRTQPRFTPDELIVTFRPSSLSAPPVGATALTQRAVASAVSQGIHSRLSAYAARGRAQVSGVAPALLAARIKVRDPRLLGDVEAELRRDPAVATVERNGIRYGHARFASPALHDAAATSSDPRYVKQAWHYTMIDLPQAWRLTTGSPAVLVAVVDDGIRFDHPDVAPNLTSDGYDFVDDSELPFVCDGGTTSFAGDGDGDDPDPTIPVSYTLDPVRDCFSWNPAFGHGLHIAGTIGAVGNNSLGGTGVNWAVRIRPVRVLGVTNSGAAWDIAQGIAYAAGLPVETESGEIVQATPGARIINVSIGGVENSPLEENAVIAATDAGSLIVVSAGNEGTSEPRYPAALPQVLAVSAVGPDGQLASYSNFGSAIDLAAPGGDFADGDTDNGDFSFGVYSTVWDFDVRAPALAYFEGTSMAAPHVSGVAALLLAQNPSLSATELRARLLDFAVDAGSPGPDQQYGAGILNARNSLTRGFEPARRIFARLHDAATGALVRSAATQADGSYAFDDLQDGEYHVVGGQDEDGDEQIGLPGRRWGLFGNQGIATPLTVAGGGDHPASFSVALPLELEPNDGFGDADVVYPGAHLSGSLGAQDLDVARVVIPQPGEYTFETSASRGACGFALNADTILKLYDANGGLITSNDDIDGDADDYCSRISTTLAAGTYYIVVESFTVAGGRYYVQVRHGT